MSDQSLNETQGSNSAEFGREPEREGVAKVVEVVDAETAVDEEGVEAPSDPMAHLEQELAEARQAAADFKDRLYRKAAELENTRRRLATQMEEVQRYGIEELLKEILPVLDDLERAIEHARKTADEQGLEEGGPIRGVLDGVDLVYKKFGATLGRFGVKTFESVGQPFDPKLHEALSQVETTDHPDGSVITEFLRGYLLHDRLVRPALVIVARNPEAAAKAAADEGTETAGEAVAGDEDENA